MPDPLKLRATDLEDLAVISSILQDALAPMADMLFEPEQSRFVLAANRFRWEDAGDGPVEGRIYERQRCGIRFEHVTKVRMRGLDHNKRDEILSLLAVKTEGDNVVDLVFAGGGVIRLEVESMLCHLDDFDEPWPTMRRPRHVEADNAEGET
jgi:Protein of unknown function (DUF2948)